MATRRITVEVEVPEGLEGLGEEELARIARSALERRLLILKELEDLIPEPLASEEEILELDREIKRALARRIEDELSKVRGD
ncbi:MAG: hypothetical protein GSR84_05235 [Desulfurococcales archaeon]|nr:hypothetical protein [Desulfurococcales archaeon]